MIAAQQNSMTRRNHETPLRARPPPNAILVVEGEKLVRGRRGWHKLGCKYEVRGTARGNHMWEAPDYMLPSCVDAKGTRKSRCRR
jgi:hypothetical protein